MRAEGVGPRAVTSARARRAGAAVLLSLTFGGLVALPAGAAEMSAGNGLASMTASQAVAAAAAALKAEPNLLIDGTITESGATIGLDVESENKGTDSVGTIVSHSATLGFIGTIRFVSLPGKLFLNGGSNFWKDALASSKLSTAQEANLLTLVVGHWIELTGSDATSFAGDLGGLVEPAKLAASLTTTTGTLRKGAPALVRQVEALPIISSKGGTLWLALVGPPLPVELDAKSTGKSAFVTFEYPVALNIHAPKSFKTLAEIEAGS